MKTHTHTCMQSVNSDLTETEMIKAKTERKKACNDLGAVDCG